MVRLTFFMTFLSALSMKAHGASKLTECEWVGPQSVIVVSKEILTSCVDTTKCKSNDVKVRSSVEENFGTVCVGTVRCRAEYSNCYGSNQSCGDGQSESGFVTTTAVCKAQPFRRPFMKLQSICPTGAQACADDQKVDLHDNPNPVDLIIQEGVDEWQTGE